jgi:hypothetical protein
MSQESVEKFIGRLVTDDTFREAVKKQFRHACLEQGLMLTEHEEAALQNLDYAFFDFLAGRMDCAIRRCGKGR